MTKQIVFLLLILLQCKGPHPKTVENWNSNWKDAKLPSEELQSQVDEGKKKGNKSLLTIASAIYKF
ncbi:unnamed protein product [Nyctereutes procyonoides]|uniref:(raccoon dog) hypothetical protein n=1 Tax=Nyctereutes procyonoides TaxID=34880 RepID=A0A811ZY48_NYCPR|nr:unnamed protein product [Nyctereutes procyonoides]